MQIGVFTGFKLQRSRFTRLLDVTPKIWILVSNSSGVDLHARAYKARYIFLWFQTPAEQIYTYLKIMCNFCRKTFQTPAEQIYTDFNSTSSKVEYSFKLQRSRFTQKRAYQSQQKNKCFKLQRSRFTPEHIVQGKICLQVSNSSGVDLHAHGQNKR